MEPKSKSETVIAAADEVKSFYASFVAEKN